MYRLSICYLPLSRHPLTWLLVAALCVALVGCAAPATPAPASTPTTTATATLVPAQVPTTAVPSSPTPSATSIAPTATPLPPTPTPLPPTVTPVPPTATVPAQPTFAPGTRETQVAAGQVQFASTCASCHGDNLEGRGAPAINARNISGFRTAAGLFEYVSHNMPLLNPGSLTQEQYYAVLGFILDRLGILPAGQPLTPENAPQINLPQ